jgi:hypothetical protein
MREVGAPYAPAERMISEALHGLAEAAGPGRHWVPVSVVARAARRSISATSVALRVAHDRGLAETRLRSLPGGSRWEYRPVPVPTDGG